MAINTDRPLLLTKGQARAFIGIGRRLFDEIEPNLPYVRISKSKRYNPSDIEREIENLRRSPCIPHPSKIKKTRTSSTPRSQFLELGGLEEVVKQTTAERQTSTH